MPLQATQQQQQHQFSSEGFDLDAIAGHDEENVVLELGGKVSTVVSLNSDAEKSPATVQETNASSSTQQQQPQKVKDPLEEAEKFKAAGNDAFVRKEYQTAYDCYTQAMDAAYQVAAAVAETSQAQSHYLTGDELLEKQKEWEEKRAVQLREELRKQDERERQKRERKRERERQKREHNGGAVTAESSNNNNNNNDEEESDDDEDAKKTNKNNKPETFQAPPHPYASQLAVYYCNRAAALLYLERYEAAVKDCDVACLWNPAYVKAFTRRSTAHEKLGQTDKALVDAQHALQLDPTNATLRATVKRLEKLEHERMEKLKAETLDKLKDLGNSILGTFGLSLDNFQTKQDPQTGSYSISFNQNK